MQVSHHTERLCPVLFQLAPEAKEAFKKKKVFFLILLICSSHLHKMLVHKLSSNVKCFLLYGIYLCHRHSWKL